MVIVDDHLALLAIAGGLPDLGVDGTVTTTWGFQFRLARALSDPARKGSLSRRNVDPAAAVRRVLHPPAHRLVVLDPRAFVDETVRAAVLHRANFLLAEILGAAVHHGASVRITEANVGRTWQATMEADGVDFAAVVDSACARSDQCVHRGKQRLLLWPLGSVRQMGRATSVGASRHGAVDETPGSLADWTGYFCDAVRPHTSPRPSAYSFARNDGPGSPGAAAQLSRSVIPNLTPLLRYSATGSTAIKPARSSLWLRYVRSGHAESMAACACDSTITFSSAV